MDVYVSNDIIISSLSSQAISVYLAISQISKLNCNYVMFNQSQIEYSLCGGMVLSSRKRSDIKSGISELIDNGVINVISCNKGEYVVENLFCVDENFTVVYSEEIISIMNMDNNLDRFLMLRYWLFVAYTLNNKKNSDKFGCGWWSIDELSEATGIHRNTVLKYNDILEKHEIMYSYRQDFTFVFDEDIRRCRNTYGRYKNKAKVIKCGIDYLNLISSSTNNKINKIHMVDGRSVSHRYNHFVKGISEGKTYDLEFVSKLNNDCEMYNENYKNVADMKLKDLSIFDEYLRGENHEA